jgi:hypothetical protein
MEEKLGEVRFKHRDPIEFTSTDGSQGISLKEVSASELSLTLKLKDAGKPIFDDDVEDVKDTVSLRLEVSLVSLLSFFLSFFFLPSFIRLANQHQRQ